MGVNLTEIHPDHDRKGIMTNKERFVGWNEGSSSPLITPEKGKASRQEQRLLAGGTFCSDSRLGNKKQASEPFELGGLILLF